MLKSLTSVRDVFYTLLEFELIHLKEYSETSEEHLIEEKQRFQDSIDEMAEKLSDEDKEDCYDFHSDEYWRLSEISPRIFRNSLLLTTYSLLEHRLMRLCLSYQRERKIALSVNDIQGKGIRKYQTYLKKVLLIEFPDQGNEWKDMLILNKIRNAIAHNDGILDENRSANDIYDFVSDNRDHIKITDTNSVQLQVGFIQLALDKVAKFFRVLHDKLPDK